MPLEGALVLPLAVLRAAQEVVGVETVEVVPLA